MASGRLDRGTQEAIPVSDGHRPDSDGIGQSLSRALRNAGIIVIHQDVYLRVVWAQNVPYAWSAAPITGLKDDAFLPGAAGELTRRKQEVLDSGEPQGLEIVAGSGTNSRTYQVWLDVDHDEKGALTGVTSTIVDITAQKHREQTLRALLREVSHRSKNLLTIILSVATQTGRYSGTIDTFLERFRGRIQSLASSQDLVTSSNWRGTTLRELVAGQAERYCDDLDHTIRFEGVDPHLTPNASLHVGLALHELMVNSMSYGAMSDPSGQVALSAEVKTGGQGRYLELVWHERVPNGGDEHERRFGSVALERVVPLSVEGEAELVIGRDEVVYRLTVGETNFEL